MKASGPDEQWDMAGRRPAPKMSRDTAIAMLAHVEERQRQGYAVVSWNGAGFDLKMLGALAGDNELAGRIVLAMYDPMYQVLSQKGFPIGLAAAQKGLGVSQAKTMDGKDAPEAWIKGEHQKVARYVVGDSEITIAIVIAILRAGGINWTTKTGKASSVSFRKLKTVAECLLDPPVDQSWQTNPIDKRRILSWIPQRVMDGGRKAAEDSADKERGDVGRGLRPVLLVISGPSGAGKTVVREEVMRTVPTLKASMTVTTRQPRKGEVDGVDYRFVTAEQFDGMAAAGEFLEWAEIHGAKYGSSKADVSSKLAKGIDVALIVDVQGADSIRRFVAGLPKATSAKFAFADVFVAPPSLDELKRRLEDRGKDDAETIDRRLENAKAEMARAGEYKYLVVNDTVQNAWDRLRSILVAERCLAPPAKQ
jgi:guanylate kinase